MSFAKVLLAVSISMTCVAQTKPVHAGPTAKRMLERIDRDGAKKVVDQLWATPKHGQWEYVVNQIQAGSDAWLDVAEKIQPGTDAGSADELMIVMSTALAHNPARVLSMIGPKFPLEEICTVPFIEPSRQVIVNHKARIHAALKRVDSRELEEKKAGCLKSIDAVK